MRVFHIASHGVVDASSVDRHRLMQMAAFLSQFSAGKRVLLLGGQAAGLASLLSPVASALTHVVAAPKSFGPCDVIVDLSNGALPKALDKLSAGGVYIAVTDGAEPAALVQPFPHVVEAALFKGVDAILPFPSRYEIVRQVDGQTLWSNEGQPDQRLVIASRQPLDVVWSARDTAAAAEGAALKAAIERAVEAGRADRLALSRLAEQSEQVIGRLEMVSRRLLNDQDATSEPVSVAVAPPVDAAAGLAQANFVAAAALAEVEEARAALARDLETTRSELDFALRENRRLQGGARNLQNDIEALRASTSWRITAPVRAAKTMMSRLRPTRALRTAPSKPVAVQADDEGSIQTRGPETAAQTSAAAKLIAFYLPQFHPIPENDRWWGEGFTEWTNVRRGETRFVGHYQPHVPAELDYYDLRDPTVQRKQAELAQAYGIGGFCFYFYWFGGKRLLETPIRAFADDDSITLPFCLCWANENWSRRWDGLESEILIAQDHSAADDLAFIAHVSDYLKSSRYIRIDGKPLLIVYRPSLLPDAKATAARWREWCRQNGVGEIYLAYTQSFESGDPAQYGFDAAIEFPPNNTAPPEITEEVELLDSGFSGKVYDYRAYPQRSRSYDAPAWPLFRGVFPSWDNEARRRGRGATFHHSSPELYRRWLTNAVRDTRQRFSDPDKQLVFINAWNEWAEGAHLEPDARYGRAWLESTRQALTDGAIDVDAAKRRIVVVTHDAYAHGAQYLALNICRVLARELNYAVSIVILGDGPMKADFARYGQVHDLAGIDPEGAEAQALAQTFARQGVVGAICNTTVSGLFAGVLARAGVGVASLIHELAGVIQSSRLERHVQVIAEHADKIVFPSTVVAESFSRFAAPADPARVVVATQGLYKRNAAQTRQARLDARARLRSHFGLPPQAELVLGLGYADHRKGFDLFVQAGLEVMAARPDAVFMWVGALEVDMGAEGRAKIDASPFADRFILPGFQAATDDFIAGADLLALTSREDPFPTVIMEALDVSVPVVGYRGAGGFEPLLDRGCGKLVTPMTAAAMAQALTGLLADPTLREEMGRQGKAICDRDYAFRPYVMDLVAMLTPQAPRVSVIVPNYNYARYLDARLTSIDQQTYPIYELIVLDDASTDDSVATAERLLKTLVTPARLIASTQNSGSVFRQWRKGVEQARGDLVWIAEADDLCEPAFLEAAVAGFLESDVVMSFTQSKQMDGDGGILDETYLDYVSDIDADKWRGGYVNDGLAEVRTALTVKNTIPNVSGAVFRRDVLTKVLDEHFDEIAALRVAGDWATYVRVLEHGRIAFDHRSLNLHRRHASSVTLGSMNAAQLREIIGVQRCVAERHGSPAEVVERAEAYAQRLYEQFGLMSGGQRLKDDVAFQDA